jgi:hypothetical protein
MLVAGCSMLDINEKNPFFIQYPRLPSGGQAETNIQYRALTFVIISNTKLDINVKIFS